ncbi:MAG: MupG family TIM beta-alpha barrel fold protein [Culicoidibacterales bacterium]
MGLGISIYPLQSSYEENSAYIKSAAALGYTRVFTSFLEADTDPAVAATQLESYRVLLQEAQQLGMRAFLDINPEIVKLLKIDPTDFQFFANLGVKGVRLDGAFNGFYEAYLTYNEYDIAIEINGSFDSGYVNSIVELGGNKQNLLTCHNFYPEADTGLSISCFESCHARHKSLGLHTAAFVTSQEGGRLGPWDANDGLCTLERHRYLPIEQQAQELYQAGIDDVIIGDAFASERELAALAQLQPTITTLTVETTDDTIDLFAHVFQNRWDYSDVVIRDVMSRKLFKQLTITPQTIEERQIAAGTILVNNDTYGRYKGEILIALQPMVIDSRRNIIGTVTEQSKSLLAAITGGKRFKCAIKTKIEVK